MKKIISIFVMTCLLMSVMISFAEDGTRQIREKDRLQQRKEEIKDRINKRDEPKAEIRSYVNQAKENKKKLRELSAGSKKAHRDAKNHIKVLMKDKDSLTDEQVLKIRDSLKILKERNIKIRNTKGDIDKMTKQLRVAKEKKNHNKVENSYKRIIEIQKSRIENLNKLIENLNNITEI